MLVALLFSLFLLSFPTSPFGQPRGASAGGETKDVEMSRQKKEIKYFFKKREKLGNCKFCFLLCSFFSLFLFQATKCARV